MNITNMFYNLNRALRQHTKAVTSTYTVRMGTVANDFQVDRVITVTDPASSFTITVPDGTDEGQELLISLLSNASAVTVTVTASTGSGGDSTMATAGMYMYLMWVNSTTGWVAVSESVTS